MGGRADPLAGIGTTAGTPPPPSAPPVGGDPLAGIGTTAASSTSSGNPLTANPNNEGLYKLVNLNDRTPVSVPYSQVPTAMQQGYGINDPAEIQRYTKDRNADPNTSTVGDIKDVLLTQPAHAAAEVGKGALKSAAQVPMTIAGWMDSMESRLRRMDELVSGQSNSTREDLISGHNPNEVHEARQAVHDFLEQHAPGITNAPINPQQQRGQLIENVAEFGVGEKGLGKVGELAKGLPWLVEGGNYAEKLKVVQPILKAAAEHPNIANALLTGLRQGTVGGAQATLHGAPPKDALKTAAITGAAGAAIEGATGAASRFLHARAPVTEALAGEEVPALSSQQPGTDARGDVTTQEVPKVGAAQQAAAPRVFRNIAQRATKVALDEANKGRVPAGQITDPARMLPAPEEPPAAPTNRIEYEGPHPVRQRVAEVLERPATPTVNRGPKFTIKGPGAEVEEFPGGNDPRKRQIGTRYVAGKGSGTSPTTEAYPSGTFMYGDEAPLPPVEDTEPFAPGQSHKEPVFQYLTNLKPGQSAGGTSVTGGGDLVSADAATAQTHLSRLNDLIDHPPAGASPEQMQAITDARDSLQEQMDLYNVHQRTLPNFSPIDSERAAGSVGHFGEAEAQLQNAAKPIYQKIDAATDGEFGKLNKARAAAAKRGDFTTKYELEDKIDQLIADSKAISPAERLQATKLWSTSKVLGGLNDVIENAANVSTEYAGQVKGGRILSGTKLQNGLKGMIDKYGIGRLETVIGKDGMENMTRMADLLKTQPQSKLQQLSLNIFHNLAHGKAGAAIGIGLGHHLAGYEGATAGAMMGMQAERMMLRFIATSPRAGQLFDYAIRNKVTPTVAAGLISSEVERELEDERQANQETPQ